MEYDEFRSMNTTILVAAEGKRRDLYPGFARVRRWVASSEQRFSRFLETSELSALNRSAGNWFTASKDLFSLLEEAALVHRDTQGLFDPSILNALKYSGYNRSMDEIRKMTSVPLEFDRPTQPTRFSQIRLDSDRRSVWMPPEMQLDLGGIAKGWIAARATELLADYTDAGAVSAGGDMVLFGLPDGEDVWQVSLEDPRDINLVLTVLNIGPGALATSSIMKRRWKQQNMVRHHIIDPRSGEPSTSSWLCVTVFAPKATYAEAFAKALQIAGPEQAWQLIENQPDLQFIAVTEDGALTGNLVPMETNYVTNPTR